jgi:hypothetical protein
MTLAQRCDEIIRMIDEVLAAEASAAPGTGNRTPRGITGNGALGNPGPEAL